VSRFDLTFICPDDKTSGSNHSGTLKNMYNYSEKQNIFPVLKNMSSLACYFTIQDHL